MVGIGKALARLLDIQAAIGIAAVGLMMFHITFDVFGKWIFNAPLPATLEIVAHYYMVVVVFLPLALVEKRDAHISVEVLTQHFADRWQKIVLAATWILSGTFFLALTYRTWVDAMDKYEVGAFIMGSTSAVPTWPTYFILPFGCLVLVLVLAYKLAIYITGAESGLGEHTGPHDIIAE